MEIQLLGPLEVRESGVPLELGGRKQRAILAMLTLHIGQVVSVDQLVDGVWGPTAPHHAARGVQVYVSRLRGVLKSRHAAEKSEGLLRRRSPGYVLDSVPDSVDVHRFRGLVREGLAALPDSPVTAAEMLRRALELWRGSPLAEFADEPFAQLERPLLEELWLNALAGRIQADLELGRHAELVGELETLIAEHPLHEGLHRQLMLSLYRSERQAEALEAFRRARDGFVQDLGIDPGRALSELEQRILSHDPALDWTPPAGTVITATEKSAARTAQQPVRAPVVRTAQGPRVWNVPPRNPHFAGRDELLAELRHRLETGANTPAVQALYGLGGVGKTQVAVEYAYRFAKNHAVVWWIDAEQPVFIPDQFARLAGRLGLPERETAPETIESTLAELASRSDWLLIFDNVERPVDVAGYRAPGPGQVLVTSRFPGWGELGGRLEVDVPTRPETVAMLRARMPALPQGLADELAAELGDLPLAAAQAAAYLEQTGMDPAEYLRRFRRTHAGLLAKGDVLAYQGRVDTAWELSLQRVGALHPGVVPLLEVAAFLAPEPIPFQMFTAHPDLLAGPLRAAAADPDVLADAVGAAVGYSMVHRDHDSFRIHRLVQAVMRSRLTSEASRSCALLAASLLAASYPGDPDDPSHWAVYARLAPHVLAVGAAGDAEPAGRQLLLATVAYLNVRGDPRASRRIAQQLYQRWRRVLGPDHADTLSAAAFLSSALAWLGEHDAARDLGRDTLDRSRRVLGPDHPDTLRLATSLAFALAWLGEAEQACLLGQDSLDRARVVLGPENAGTLRLAANLTFALVVDNQGERACELGEDTVRRASSVLGPDHPVTLVSAGHLALALAWLGRADEHLTLMRETLTRSRQALGPDHPTTLGSAAHLSIVLVWHGDAPQARALGEDAMQRSRGVLGPDHLITLVASAAVALALAADGQSARARDLGQDIHEKAQQMLGTGHLITLVSATALIDALIGLGEAEQARVLGRDTLEQCRRTLGTDHLLTIALSAVVQDAQEVQPADTRTGAGVRGHAVTRHFPRSF